MIDPLRPAQVPTGLWQRIVGAVLAVIGIWALLAGDYRSAISLLTFAGPLLFWGAMLRWFHLVEAKLDLVIDRGSSADGRLE